MLRLKKIRLFLAIVILLAGATLVATVMLKFEKVGPPPQALEALPKNVDMALHKVHYSEVQDGKKKWDLFADKAVFNKTSEIFHLNVVKLVVAGKAETGDITLTADRADYDSKSKNVILDGKVRAKSVSGLHFSTDRAVYLADRSLIKSSDPIRFTDGKIELSGVGMELNTATKDLKVMKDVTAALKSGITK